MSDTVKRKARKRNFSEAWLTDDRFKSWIRKVSFDDTLFRCILCHKNFSCSLSHVLRHADSACHKNNIKGSTSLSLNNNDVNKKMAQKKEFKDEWLEIDLFKPWLRKVANDVNSVFCTFCDTSIAAGLSQIYRHAESKKHVMICKQNEIENKSDQDVSETLLAFKKQTKLAEIRFAALIADKSITIQTANEILTLFQEIGKDHSVLKNMSMGRTKCTNIISNVLCPVETDSVVQNLQNTKFSIIIDEPFEASSKKWMTFLVRYVDLKTLDARTQLIKLINIEPRVCTAETLIDAFKSEMWTLNIPFLNIVSLSCNNVPLMTDKHLSFKTKLGEMCKNLLTLTCPCYSTALVVQAACAKIPEYCEEFLKKIANFTDSCPNKNSTIYQELRECFQETNQKILKLSDTRWLSRHSCIESVLESWDTLKLFLDETPGEDTKFRLYLVSMMQTVDIKAYLLFLNYILPYFDSFIGFFQSVDTRIHLLQPKSVKLLTTICNHFLKSELLGDIENNVDNIKFAEKENQKLLEEVYLGIKCEEYLNELTIKGHSNMVAKVRENCLHFFVTAAREISKRLPINDKFLSTITVFQSQTALLDINREASFYDVSYIAKTFGDFDENGLKKEWLTLHLDFGITEKKELVNLNFDDMWKQILQSQCSANIDKYPNLKCLLNAVRSLPNSNADPEKMPSVLTDLEAKKRKKLSAASINAICVFKSALKSRKETVLDMEIDAKHLSLMSSDKLYNILPREKQVSLPLFVDVNNIAGPSSSNDMQ